MALLDNPPQHLETSYNYARILQWQDTATGDEPDLTAVSQLFGVSVPWKYFAPTATRPAVGVAQNFDATIISLSGIDSRGQAASLVSSWLSRTDNFLNQPFPVYVIGAAVSAIIAYRSVFSGPRPKCRIIGHSFGGLVAMSLLDQLRRAAPDVDYQLVTFGSPKGVGNITLSNVAGVSQVRWVLTGDPVVAIPPVQTQAPLIHGLLAQRDSTNLASWTHLSLPTVINALNVVTTPFFDPDVAPFTAADLSGLLSSTQGLFGLRHGMLAYRTSLGNIVNAPPPVAPDPPPVSPTRPRPPVVTPEIRAAINNAVVLWRDAALDRDAIPVDIPAPSRFLAKRTDRTWSVHWMLHEICVCPHKRKARAICRHANRMLRIFQGVGMCNSTNFVQALIDYLTDAANADVGYKPTLNDGGEPPVPYNIE